MILLADSGSTKCDWLLVEKDGRQIDAFKTMGFNPFFHTRERIEEEIRGHSGLMKIADQVKYVDYYGAGCSQDAQRFVIEKALSSIFTSASIDVDHDMKAAVYATWQEEPCITCILGTGSNAAFFDGRTVHSKNAGIGYILGDEGSGAYFGKKLLAAYLYGQLPAGAARDLEQEYGVNRSGIFQNVYEKPHANIYLSGFTPFIAKYKDLPLFDTMLHEGMKSFLQIHVCGFDGFENVKTHFVGSVAFHFQTALHRAAADLHVQVGQIIQAPIKKLLDYHVRYKFPHYSE
ncbi:MAG: N-acetylglucosamine kinase [Bacteroidia bacterium]